MAVERKFLEEQFKKVKIDKYVRRELKNAGVGEVFVKRTPLGTRITIEAARPGILIGRKGKNIQDLTRNIQEKFKVENPQIEVGDVPVTEFNPGIVAHQLAQTLEAGVHFRRACHDMLNQIMRKGALGAMIVVTGKISGARARSEKFKAGYIRYCGEPALNYVRQAIAEANLKPGKVGIKIKIMPPIEKPQDALGLVKIAQENAAAQQLAMRSASQRHAQSGRRGSRKRRVKVAVK